MRTASEHCGSSRFRVIPLAAILALCGCHSGGAGGPTNPNPATGYAYVASASATPGGAGAVYEYAVLSDGSLSPLAQASIAAGINSQFGNVYVYSGHSKSRHSGLTG
jgi:hypothetical protein